MTGWTGGIVAGALALVAGAGGALAAVQYMDDRSTPKALVQSYYNAINQQQYARAYGYFSEGFAPKDYDSWVKGYADTASVAVQVGATRPDPGAGQIYWALPVAISVRKTDGSHEVFAGCYTIHMTNPGMQDTPPYQPMSISGAELAKSSKPVQDAVPDSCGD